jgi:hypothetical protein
MSVVEVGTVLFRAVVDSGQVIFERQVVAKLTAKGFWIGPPVPVPESIATDDAVTLVGRLNAHLGMRGLRWYSRHTRQWSGDEDAALQRLVARKMAHVRHASRRLSLAQRDLATAKAVLGMNTSAALVRCGDYFSPLGAANFGA